MLRAVLARAVRLRGGEERLSEGERGCLDLVRRWMNWIYVRRPRIERRTFTNIH